MLRYDCVYMATAKRRRASKPDPEKKLYPTWLPKTPVTVEMKERWKQAQRVSGATTMAAFVRMSMEESADYWLHPDDN